MIAVEETNNPKLVEELVCIPMDKLPKSVLDEDEMRFLISVITQKDNPEELMEGVEDSQLGIGYQIFKQRLNSLDIRITPLMGALVACRLKSPGDAVLLALYVAYKLKRYSEKVLNSDTLCRDVFPLGYPDLECEQAKAIWRGQKVKRSEFTDTELSPPYYSDNLVNYPTAMESLRSVN